MENTLSEQTEPSSKELFASLTARLDLLTAVLFVVTYLLMLTEPAAVSSERVVLASLGALYLAVATLGFAYVQRQSKLPLSLLYLGGQLAFGAVLWSLGGVGVGGTLLVLLVLSQGTRLLPLPWPLVFCLLLPFLHLGMAWQDLLRQGTGLLISGVFVVLITRVAVNERRLRAQKEALAEELGEANAKLRRYASQVEELSTLRERNRLAREIHDGLGHHLTAVHVQLQAAQAILQHDLNKAAVALEKARSLTQDALLDVRRSVGALRTSERPLTEALSALAHEATAAGVPTEVMVIGTPRRLEPPIESSLFRVAQEGLTNVRKHARATHSAMKLRYEPDTVELIVEDDGIGAADVGGGYGLLGIRERVVQLGGEVSITTSPQEGFIFSARVPV